MARRDEGKIFFKKENYRVISGLHYNGNFCVCEQYFHQYQFFGEKYIHYLKTDLLAA